MEEIARRFSEVTATVPVVYGIVDLREPSKIVYVGKTINAKKRFEHYRFPEMCHNQLLKEWLINTGEHAGFVLLDVNPEDINRSERHHIAALRDSLLNLVSGGDQAWRKYSRAPWSSGRTKCPSDRIIMRLRNNGRRVSIDRSAMTVRQRCEFEVSLCIDLWKTMPYMREDLSQWLSVTGDKMIAVLEK